MPVPRRTSRSSWPWAYWLRLEWRPPPARDPSGRRGGSLNDDGDSIGGSATVFNAGQSLFAPGARQPGPGERLTRAIEGTADQAASSFLTREDVASREAEADSSRGASVAQLADRGLAQVEDRLDRLVELAREAEDSTIGDDRRATLNAEFSQLRDEIDDIVAETSFDGEGLLDATETVSFATGTGNTDSIEFELLDATADGLGLSALTLDSSGDATTARAAAEAALGQVESARANVGGTLASFQDRENLVTTQAETLEAAQREAAEEAEGPPSVQDLAATVIAEEQAAVRAQASQKNLPLLDLLV